MRRAQDVIVLLAAVVAATLWYRATSNEKPKEEPVQDPVAASVEAPATLPPIEANAIEYEPASPAPETMAEELERVLAEDQAQREADATAEEQARIDHEEQDELSRRDAERREAFDKHKSLRNQRISEARDREERAQSAKASYEALRQHRRDCARTTKNGSYQAYGCEGINDRVRKAETTMKNARNRR